MGADFIRAVDDPSPNVSDLKELYESGIENLNADQYEAAIKNFKKILQARPDMAPIHNILGVAYIKQNKSIQNAINAFTVATEMDPDYGEAYFNLAAVYMGVADDHVLGEEYLRKTIEVDPDFAQAYYGLAWLLVIDSDNAQGAVPLFKRVVELKPDFAEAHYGLGMAYLQLGKRAEVLQPISVLRSLNRNDLATKIESLIQNRDEAIVFDAPVLQEYDYAGFDEELPSLV